MTSRGRAPPEAEAHDHSHADVSGGWLRAAVFGAMDGLVTNTALVAGVGGGGAAPRAIVLAGVASLVAGAISMALGEYTSVKTQNEQLDLEVEKERRELERNPDGRAGRADRDAAACAASTSGLGRSEVAVQLSRDPETALRLHVVAELGLNPEDKPSPLGGGGLVVPDVRARARCSRCCPTCSASRVLWAGAAVGGVGLLRRRGAVAPASRRARGGTPGLRQLLFGAVAAGITYAIGAAIGVTVCRLIQRLRQAFFRAGVDHQQDQHQERGDADQPDVLELALVVAEHAWQQDSDRDTSPAAPLAGLAVPAPLLGALVLDGVRVGTDDALFATRLVDPLRVTHASAFWQDARPQAPREVRAVSPVMAVGEDAGVSSPREVTVLGSTGSIGRQAIEVARAEP